MTQQLDRSKTKVTPLQAPVTRRSHDLRVLTSIPAGRMTPVAAIPLLREDGIRRATMRFSFEQMETAEVLMNAQHISARAYFVSHLALTHFNGSMDQLNRSYMGQPPMEGAEVVPFIRTDTWPIQGNEIDSEILKYLGMHSKRGAEYNTAYEEAYNLIWNFRAKNRSKDIELINPLTNRDLQPAFWRHVNLASIRSDVDFAAIDGEVPLNYVGGDLLRVRGIGATNSSNNSESTVRESGGVTVPYPASANTSSTDRLSVKYSAEYPEHVDVWAELEQDGITISLSNIELARRAQSFAKLREQYAGHDDEWIIDLLMDGVRIPEQALRQPILVGQQSTIVGQAKRYATDSGSLTESVVSGMTAFDMTFRVPRTNTGGVVLVVVEALPEQLFERQADPYLQSTDHEEWPHYLRDVLDPEPVTVIKNGWIDSDHNAFDDTFGYAALNHNWNYLSPRVGGRFYRPEVDASFDEDRQRIWAVETENPTLTEDYYISREIHTKPFADQEMDPYEVVTQGRAEIDGITHFGPPLMEEEGNFDAVMAKAPMDRIPRLEAPETEE